MQKKFPYKNINKLDLVFICGNFFFSFCEQIIDICWVTWKERDLIVSHIEILFIFYYMVNIDFFILTEKCL